MQEKIHGFYPIYLPQDSVLSKKVIFAEHERSLHGGVAMAMSHVRSLFWTLHLRRISKSVIRNCYGKYSEVYHTILQNQDHFLKIELKNVFDLRL